MRAIVAVAILTFNIVFDARTGARSAILALAALALVLNWPYYLAARTGKWRRLQAHVRSLVDVVFVTGGLFEAGGLAAAPYLSVYMIIPVYTGLVFSSTLCLVTTGFATASYLAVAGLQEIGWLPFFRAPLPNAWAIAVLNLLVLNITGVLTAFLAEVYRRSRRRETALHRDLERANDALLKLNVEIQRSARLQVLGEVVAGVAHEIRNTQQVTMGYLALAREKAALLAPAVAQDLERAEDSCAATMRIVRNALDMARQPSAERAPVSLAHAAAQVVDLKRHDFQRDGIVVRLDFPVDFPPIPAVPFQLQQVLLNLLTNAHEALRGRSGRREIAIAGRVEALTVVAEVRDNGPGIPSEALARILEPFYTTKPDGTGLGLAISSAIVRDLGGELSADNRPQGGAVFRLTFPVGASRQ